jgi:hypothetical protein
MTNASKGLTSPVYLSLFRWDIVLTILELSKELANIKKEF